MKKNEIKSRIKRDKGEEQKYLEILNRHFKTVTYEKYPDAMLNIIFSETFDEILGVNFSKKRVSKRKEKKIRERILEKLRKKYGRWINLTNFKIKTPGNTIYRTNFHRVYRVENLGILYGSPSELVCGGIFYTSHCLERFEERIGPMLYAPITERLRELYKTEPTSADIIIGLIMASNLEYGKWSNREQGVLKEFCYLNIRIGAIALENLGDMFIAKTFLTPEMINEEMKWSMPILKSDETFSSFGDLLQYESLEIKRPIFLLI